MEVFRKREREREREKKIRTAFESRDPTQAAPNPVQNRDETLLKSKAKMDAKLRTGLEFK